MDKNKKSWTVGRILKEIVVFILILFVLSTALNYIRAPKLDSDKLPSIKATLVDGSHFSTKDIINKPLMINFWGTWCPVCSQEASNIETLSKKYRVLTIAVNSGNDQNIKTWLKEKGVNYPVLNDQNSIWAKKFKISVYPTTFIYDSHGKLKFTETGYSTTVGLIARMKLAQ